MSADERNSGEKSTVAVVKTGGSKNEHLERGFRSLLQALGGLEAIVPSHVKRVLIKPNLMMGEGWRTGITVHPYLIELLVREIKKLGCEVIVGEGAGWGCGSDEAFRGTGVSDLCERLNVPLIDFKRGKGIRVPVHDGFVLKDVLVDEILIECDFIVSLAKLKTHCETVVSLSLKNMKGLITEDRERLRFHLLDVNRCLIDLNRVYRPNLSIVDGVIALEGIGPLRPGRPKPLGILVGGTNPLSVDAVCATIMGIDPRDIRHLSLAEEAGIGTMDLSAIEIRGEKPEDVAPPSYEFPPLRVEDLSPYDNIQVSPGNPCSNCIASLASYLHGYIDRKIIEEATHRVNILIGAKAKSKGSGDEIAIGNCLLKYRGKLPFVPGCPPPSDAYLELIELGLKGKFPVATVNSDGKVVPVDEK
jgi:uncharacterized protein (DUF362 family)